MLIPGALRSQSETSSPLTADSLAQRERALVFVSFGRRVWRRLLAGVRAAHRVFENDILEIADNTEMDYEVSERGKLITNREVVRRSDLRLRSWRGAIRALGRSAASFGYRGRSCAR
jgi:hypothetical protein